MYHLVYLTRNLINNKIYVGKHSTWNEEDGYLGSGLKLKNAIKKHGKEIFERIILHYCYDEQQMTEIEIQIVDESFVARKDTYNLCVGGNGGAKIFTEESKKKMSESQKKHSLSEGFKKNMYTSENTSGSNNIMYKKHHTKESIKKMSINRSGIPAHNKGKRKKDLNI
jgi:hypothetical protein